MTNKIVILQNSVELYEHYINDEKWEKTLSFPKGGLTYNISNGTIKFFAFEDYLYRNCLMSMQLPIYIIDEEHDIEGEYSSIGEIVDILDEIFPTNGNGEGQDLSAYLKKREARELYQPIGDYVTTDELDEVLDDYYTKDEVDDLLDDKVDIDDVYTKDEADARFQPIGDYVSADTFAVYTAQTSGILDGKLDITAYTPFDPSNYYNKIEIDNMFESASTFDPSNYYNKSQADDRFALKNEIPSLSGYATEEWVLSKGYVTNSTMQQYINNLQQQINSIIESVSGCCSEPATLYRWITLTGENDFICSGTTKYEKQQKQQSIDNGMTWTNVVPAEYQKGAVLETDSEDCGYAPDPQYRWKAAPTSDYLCSGTSKYYKVYYEVSYDNGQTWQHVQPEQTKRGDLIEANSTDCGYIAPQYRWKAAPASDYLCSGTSKYYKVYYEVSYDNGSTWQHVQPEQTKRGDLIEANSPDCGWKPTNADKYLTFIPSESGTFKFTGKGTIPNTASYSLDSGATWTSLASGANTPTVNSGTKVMWKGSMIPDDMTPSFGVGTFSSTCKFAVEGNPMSLLFNDNFASQKSLSGKRHAFANLFENCTKLTSIDNIALPATTLEASCYQYMFEGCTSLISVPNNLLSATTLKEGCYCGMFKDCTSLTNMPNLNGTNMGTLARDCYNSMFAGCTSLTTAKKLPATDLGYSCYHMMFKDCTNLTTVPTDMLPATTLKDYCYGEMFYGCSKLTTAPTLPAATLVYACYNGMFENCSKLNYIKCLATSINATYATTAWVKGVQTNSGTFVKNPNMNSWTVCDTSYYKGIPCNWTVQNNS